MFNLIADAEIKSLRRAKAFRHLWLIRASTFEASANSYEYAFAADLAEWEAGRIERSDLADPRNPEVAEARASYVAGIREAAALIRDAAPTD